MESLGLTRMDLNSSFGATVNPTASSITKMFAVSKTFVNPKTATATPPKKKTTAKPATKPTNWLLIGALVGAGALAFTFLR